MGAGLGVRAVYAQLWGVYRSWARLLLPLACVVFVPLGLLSAIPVHIEVDSLDLGSGLAVLGVLALVLALIGTSLFGEIFFSGVVAVSLTHEGEPGGPPRPREIARRLAYGRLIAVDLVYAFAVAIGLALLVLPGVLAFVFLGLAGAVVEIERRGAGEALARSARLVRGRFWLVFAVLAPLEILSEGFGALADELSQALLGHSVWADWLAESLSNIVATPFVSIACVLLAVDLIREKEGSGPRLHSHPSR
jgi:hypothetical protein